MRSATTATARRRRIAGDRLTSTVVADDDPRHAWNQAVNPANEATVLTPATLDPPLRKLGLLPERICKRCFADPTETDTAALSLASGRYLRDRRRASRSS